jgi:hypothetical protein
MSGVMFALMDWLATITERRVHQEIREHTPS